MTTTQVFDPNETTRILTRNCCGRCWGHLLSRPANDGSRNLEVYCPVCGSGCGLVYKGWVERRKQESLGRALDASYNLRGVLPCLGPKRTEKELLEGLK